MGLLSSRRDDWDDALDAWEARDARPEGPDRLLRPGDPTAHAERREFLERNPWPVFRAQVDHRLERTETRSRLNLTLWFSGLGLATSVAVAVLFFLTPPASVVMPQEDAGLVRTKGGAVVGPLAPLPKASLQLQTEGRDIQSGTAVRAGAELHLSVSTHVHDHVFIFGIERDGTLSAYYPDLEEGSESLLLGLGQRLGLPDSVELDESLHDERFVAVFSSQPLAWAQVRQAATRAWRRCDGLLSRMGPLGIPDTEEDAVWIGKRP